MAMTLSAIFLGTSVLAGKWGLAAIAVIVLGVIHLDKT